MRKTAFYVILAAVFVFGVAQFASAQGPPRPGKFGRGGPEGPGRPGGLRGLMEGQRGCVPTASAPSCPEYQVTFTITSTVPVLLGSSPGTPNTITKVTTGTLAGDRYGDTYREVNLSGIGSWAFQGGSGVFIYVKNLVTMMDYIVDVTKGTYEQFPVHPRTPPANWQGKGPRNGGGSDARPTPTAGTYIIPGVVPADSYTCATEDTTFSHDIKIELSGATSATTATITTNRVYCPALNLVVSESHSDPRFGTRTYQLSAFNPKPSASLFAPPFDLTPAPTLVEGKKFGRGEGPRDGRKQPPPQP